MEQELSARCWRASAFFLLLSKQMSVHPGTTWSKTKSWPKQALSTRQTRSTARIAWRAPPVDFGAKAHARIGHLLRVGKTGGLGGQNRRAQGGALNSLPLKRRTQRVGLRPSSRRFATVLRPRARDRHAGGGYRGRGVGHEHAQASPTAHKS